MRRSYSQAFPPSGPLRGGRNGPILMMVLENTVDSGQQSLPLLMVIPGNKTAPSLQNC